MNSTADVQRLWNQKVAELAGRGVPAHALLDFMQLSPSGMSEKNGFTIPHFFHLCQNVFWP